jgi:nitronate monooxygenase
LATEQAAHLRSLLGTLRAPALVAPMFLVSGSAMVVAACRAGLGGAFPAANARTLADLELMCSEIAAGVDDLEEPVWAANVLCHSSYDRLDAEMEILLERRPPIVICALGSPGRVRDQVHAQGGILLADVSTPTLARKAIDAGADGLILVGAGAGGHAGPYNGFALASEVRTWWDGPMILAGGITGGAGVLAAQALGADAAYLGTRFLAATESLASSEYRAELVSSSMEDVVLSDQVTGVPANWLRPSLPRSSEPVQGPDFSGAIAAKSRAWAEVWSAGHGVGSITELATTGVLADQVVREYADAVRRLDEQTRGVEQQGVR